MTTHEKQKAEPLFRVVKRDAMPTLYSVLIRVGAGLLALLVCSILSIFLVGANPIKFIVTLFDGAFGMADRIWVLAKDSAILLCIALALAPAFRMRFWNIGAEGQVFVGALASVACIIALGGKVPAFLLLILMFVFAIVAGAVWAGLPAIFKARWGTNETLFTLMLNYVAALLVDYFLIKWVSSGSSTLGELKFGHFPVLINENFLVILIALVLTGLLYVYMNYTKQGYEIAVVGESENTARYVGIRVGRVIVRTMLISGALCGIAGFLIVSAMDHTITPTTVGGLGFTAILVAWLGKFNPLAMIGASVLITTLDKGGSHISTVFNISDAFPNMVIGVILFFIIGSEFFIHYRLKFRPGIFKALRVGRGGTESEQKEAER